MCLFHSKFRSLTLQWASYQDCLVPEPDVNIWSHASEDPHALSIVCPYLQDVCRSLGWQLQGKWQMNALSWCVGHQVPIYLRNTSPFSCSWLRHSCIVTAWWWVHYVCRLRCDMWLFSAWSDMWTWVVVNQYSCLSTTVLMRIPSRLWLSSLTTAWTNNASIGLSVLKNDSFTVRLVSFWRKQTSRQIVAKLDMPLGQEWPKRSKRFLPRLRKSGFTFWLKISGWVYILSDQGLPCLYLWLAAPLALPVWHPPRRFC